MRTCHEWERILEWGAREIGFSCLLDLECWGLGLTIYLTHWGRAGAKVKAHLGPVHLHVDYWAKRLGM
ncbi:MAG: hypothetical protein V2A73_11850 [Pseudomonadota bacterium]